jgi:NADPH2:quinone reductase
MVRAIQVTKLVKSVDELKVADLPEPEPGDNEITVEGKAFGLNFYDILMVQGKYQVKPPLPFVAGTEFSGVVRKVGKNVKRWKVGQPVFGTINYGAFAEVIKVKATDVLPMPPGMAFEQAAGFGMVYATSYLGLIVRGGLQQGETVLIHAAAGGVGLAAVQIAKAVGATVIGTVGSNAKVKVVKESGADLVLNYSEKKGEEWVKEVMAFTKNKGVDVVYDPVGGDVFDLSTKCIAWGGRLLVVGFTSGRIPEIAANRILLKNMSVIGVFLGSHIQRDPKVLIQYIEVLSQMFAKGLIKPTVYKTYGMDDVAQALKALGSRESYGKVIMVPSKARSAL